MSERFIEKYAKGRFSISQKIIKALGIVEGDAFVVEVKDKKIILSKLTTEDLEKIK